MTNLMAVSQPCKMLSFYYGILNQYKSVTFLFCEMKDYHFDSNLYHK